jgi:hypothetical protein
VFDPQPTPSGVVVHDVVIVIYSKDEINWQGTFGSNVAECSIHVLCENEEELQSILFPAKNENAERLTHAREVS